MEYEVNEQDVFQLELTQRQKGIEFHGHQAGTLMHGAALLEVLDQVTARYGYTHVFKSNGFRGWLKHQAHLKLRKLLKDKKWRERISRFAKVPSVFYPVGFGSIHGGLKMTYWDGEPDIATKGLITEYKTLTEWEPETSELIRKHVNKDSICLDVGASTGPMTVLLCSLAKHVISVEPTERCFNYLCRNIEANGFTNCTPLKMAAWDKEETVRMPMNDPHPVFANGVNLDKWLEDHGYDKIDFIKMDIDGPEPNALKGLERTIQRNPNLKMVIEYYPKYIMGAGLNPKDFMDFINKYFTHKVIPNDYDGGCWNLFCTRA